MSHRTEIQIALLVVGVFAWGYGQRIEEQRLQIVGIVLFAAATALRFLKRREAPPE